MNRLFQIVLFIMFSVQLLATHNRAGEITYKQISDYTFEFTLVTYTYTLSAADRDKLDFEWGDGTISIGVERVEKILLPDNYTYNRYVTEHTFPGPGTYEIVVEDPNRNYGVQNIPNSVNTVFSVKTTLVLNPDIGYNNTPILLSSPIHKAALNRVFIHIPTAYDIDGDSLSYEFTVCTQENGEPIDGYELPEASDTIKLDPISGELFWDSPVDTGIYNVAIGVNEWREGIKIGQVTRDMQIEVYDTDNDPPVNEPLSDICIEAGKRIAFEVIATDENRDTIDMEIIGGAFELNENPAYDSLIQFDKGITRKLFAWNTQLYHVQKDPYQIVVNSQDRSPDIRLVDIDFFTIQVIGPAPLDVKAYPTSTAVKVIWQARDIKNISKFSIYRSDGPEVLPNDECLMGVPESSSYKKIAQVNPNKLEYVDNNNGNGLIQGVEYHYVVVAEYPDGAQSSPSEPAMATLVPGTPAFTNVSVEEIHEINGKVLLKWIMPRKLDTIPANGPYKYLIYRSNDFWGEGFTLIDSLTELSDTSYLDTNLNTVNFPYTYTVELYNDEPGNRFLIGFQESVSTTYPELLGADNKLRLEFKHNVPWINNEYTVFKQTDSGIWDSLAHTINNYYIDSGLVNGNYYTYKIRSFGSRKLDDVVYKTINNSHKNTGSPLDTIPPPPPTLYVDVFCDSMYNFLHWDYIDTPDEVFQFNVYYTNSLEVNPEKIVEQSAYQNWEYLHYATGSLGACYYITALDSVGNESVPSNKVCNDFCSFYEIPNVFTPNNDTKNDLLIAHNPDNYVKKVDFKLYTRGGTLVYETEDPAIKWDGLDITTKQLVAPGVYYYFCDVYEPRLTGEEVRNIVGFVYIFHESKTPQIKTK